jgi:8-hydroxy-5-deazaflavin:NADPH oxidoreductase
VKVAVIGGTGKMGVAVARRLAKNHEVIIGSRDPVRAEETAKQIKGAVGADYHVACKMADAILFSIPYSAIGSMAELAEDASGKLALSLINPLRMERGMLEFPLDKGSAAEELARLLPHTKMATAFNNVPRAFFDEDFNAQIDILIAADSKETFERAAQLVRSVGQWRPLYAGPLSQAGTVERITALVLNLAGLNGTGTLTTKFVSRKG